MDEFTAIADDLSTWEHHFPSYAPGANREGAAKLNPIVLSRLKSELKPVAVLVCVMTSAANALEHGAADQSLAKIIVDFCPRESSKASIGTDSLANAPAGQKLVESVQHFHARLAFAQMLTKHLEGKRTADAPIKTHDLEILADAWRRTCASILALLAAVGQASGATPPTDNDVLVAGFLKNCVRGGAPCLDENGNLHIPGWAERRSAARVAVEQPAQASTGGDYFDVSVINASKVGLGLSGDAINGQHTTVVFPDGRSVSGTVKWSEEGRFGLQLDEPLATTDVLLTTTPKRH